MNTHIAVAMSGGADSTAAALELSRRGYRITGLTMLLHPDFDPGPAERAAGEIGVPLRMLDLRPSFQTAVVEPFCRAYASGKTPNPCILCNRSIKFGIFWEHARGLGAGAMATGHHVRTVKVGGVWCLRRAEDDAKDQSYALFALTAEQRSHTLFPMGEITKPEARERLRNAGVSAADEGESQDICFIPGGNYSAFLERRGSHRPPGRIRHVDGRLLGEHGGIHRFTVGQRRGIGVPADRPLYVIRLDPSSDEVIVGPREALGIRSFEVRDWNWHLPASERAADVLVQTRHRQAPAPARLLERRGRMLIRWEGEPRGVTPGQAAVAYRGDVLAGGGWITGPA